MKSEVVSVKGRQVWDSRGRPTVEVDIRLDGGATGRAIAPAGASRGIHEAIDLRDGGTRFGGYGVMTAVANVNGPMAKAIVGRDASDQLGIDAALAELDGTPNFANIGGNAAVATSLAVLHSAAATAAEPLWRYLSQGDKVRLPLPEIQIFGGGAHAGRRTDIQDFMITMPCASGLAEVFETANAVYRAAGELMAEDGLLAGTADEGGWWPNFTSNEQALAMLVRAIERAGYKPGLDVFISLDVAASEFHDGSRYRLGLDGAVLDTETMISRVQSWCTRYPVLSVEDPASQEDAAGMRAAAAALPGVQIVGDDFLVTDPERIQAAARAEACNAALIKINQAGTISRAKAAHDAARANGWASIVSARSGETEDVSIAHLATGWNAGQIKVGSFARSERMAKWNELLRIEEEMGKDAVFAGWSALPEGVRR